MVCAALLLGSALAATGSAHNWKKLTNQANANASTMLLLMDGRVLMHSDFSTKWWILTPDAIGSYLNGTWTKAADSKYDRLYYASGVLADGRVIVAGGEYSSNGGDSKVEIYDPIANQWTVLASPPGWGYIGDAPSVVLADGRFLLGNINDGRNAIYDPIADSWTPVASKLNGTCVEETYTLMPDGTVLTCDCSGHPNSELYDPVADQWVNLGNVPVDLVDASLEIGPALMQNDGQCFCMGATSHSALYTPSSTPGGVGSWAIGPDPPLVHGIHVGAVDAPAAMLPSGNILCALGSGFSPPTYFFEYDGTQFIRTIDPKNNGGPPYVGRMLIVPSGKILFAAGTVHMYSPDGTPDPSWQPTITDVASDLIPGETYVLKGTQLNGITTGCSYGDDAMMATNYPLVRLRFTATNDLVYCRAFDPSTMGFATGSTEVSVHFTVPANCETGDASIEVVANGIASDKVDCAVRDAITIDFDALASGVVVTNQFPEATFSSEPGFENRTDAQNAGSSQPNVICTGAVGGALDCAHDTYVDFPCPVASLTFLAVNVDGTGPVASVNVFEDGVLTNTVDVEGAGDPTTPVRVDLTSFHDVTRVELIAISDANGIGWDDFRFCLASSASWTNYGNGFPGTLGIPSFTMEQDPVLGTTVTADLGNSAGIDTRALIFVGSQQTSVPTSKGGDLLVIPLFYVLVPLPIAGAALDADIPNDPTLCGADVFAQAIEEDAGAAKGTSFTAGLKLHLGY
jgi:hypothetical protein